MKFVAELVIHFIQRKDVERDMLVVKYVKPILTKICLPKVIMIL